MDSLALRFIHQIDTYGGARQNFDCLQNKVQISFQTGGVADDDGGVRSAKTQKVAGGFLLGGVRKKRVRPRNIDKNVWLVFKPAGSLRGGNRFAGPVSGVLMQSRQRVDHGALSDVWITAYSDDAHGGIGAIDVQSRVKRGCSCGLYRQPHGLSPLSSGSWKRPDGAGQSQRRG